MVRIFKPANPHTTYNTTFSLMWYESPSQQNLVPHITQLLLSCGTNLQSYKFSYHTQQSTFTHVVPCHFIVKQHLQNTLLKHIQKRFSNYLLIILTNNMILTPEIEAIEWIPFPKVGHIHNELLMKRYRL